MGAQLRVYRRRIASVTATKKITRAQELIATSRIVQGAAAGRGVHPVRAGDHPGDLGGRLALEREAPADRRARGPARCAAIVLVTADRGFAGAYNSAAIKQAEQLVDLLRRARARKSSGTSIGRKGAAYYRFRGYRTGRGLVRLLRQPAVRRRGRGRRTSLIDATSTKGARGRRRGRAARGLHRVRLDAHPERRRPRGSCRWRSRSPPSPRPAASSRSTSSSRPRPRCSTPCCRTTSRRGCSTPCCSRRPRSTPPGGGR